MNKNPIYRYDTFYNGKTLFGKKKNRLPAMGWNSWNAFGSGNTEALTKAMADKIVELGLKDLGYEYVVLDDGCYKPVRVEGLLSNEEVKFPSGFKALSDYIHGKGLKFGMYNDIGTNLCAGAAVGTCGHEYEDAGSYLDWGVDFLKVDNCYYLWDNATFSDPKNAKYVFAPNIKSIEIKDSEGFSLELSAVKDGTLVGDRLSVKDDYVTGIGTWDGTGPFRTPIGLQSGELHFVIDAPKAGDYELRISYATGEEEGIGSFLQLALGTGEEAKYIFDDFVSVSGSTTTFARTPIIKLPLEKGENLLRIMNHRRQENTLASYGTLIESLNSISPDNDMYFSMCEWGKTFPNNWGYKVGDSWRILNDITFYVGSDGDPGGASWEGDYTNNLAAQYNKAVIMDEFAGLDKGWNDPDMMMIGMKGLDDIQCRTHMAMWCLMNSPLMLGLDLRRVEKGDALWQIIANKELIALNQDSLGIQAKRIFSTMEADKPDKAYIRDNHRVDVLAKPLSDGSIALAFINMDKESAAEPVSVDTDRIVRFIGNKMTDEPGFKNAKGYTLKNLWTGEEKPLTGNLFASKVLSPCECEVYRISPVCK